MAITIVNQWSGGVSSPAGFTFPNPSGSSTVIPVANTDGNWLVALMAWQCPAGYSTTMTAGDDARNKWEPLGAPAGTSSPAGLTRCSIWAAPNAAAAKNVFPAPTGYTPAFMALILEVAGMGSGESLEAVTTNFLNATFGPLTASLPAVAQQALVLALGAGDLAGTALNLTGTGWTALTPVSTTNGVDHTADMQLAPGYQVTSGATSANWAPASGTMDLACCMVALAVTQAAPIGPSQNWPLVQFQAGFGAGVQTPWDLLTWTDLTTRYRGADGQRGKQYELDSVQAGTLNLSLSNNDAALTPGNTSSPYYQGLSPWTGQSGAVLYLSQAYAWTGQSSILIVPAGSASPGAVSERVAVVAGSSYSASAAMLTPQGWSAGAQVIISWFNSGGGFLSTSSGTPVAAAAGQWVFPSVTAAAPAGAAFATMTAQANGTPAATTLFYACLPMLLGPAGQVLNANWNLGTGPQVYTPVRLLTTWAGRTGVLWRGFMERWPQALTGARYQVSNAVATDMWATLTTLLDNCVRAETLIDKPFAFWALDDPAGSTSAADLSGNAGPLVVTESKFGTGATGSQSFGANSNAFAGSPSGTTWQQAGLATGATDDQHGWCLKYQSATLPKLSQGVTINCWVNFATGNQPTDNLIVWVMRNSNGQLAQLWASPSTNSWHLSVKDQTTGVVTDTVIMAATAVQGFWINFTVMLTQTTWQVLVNGGGTTPTVGSGTCNLSNNWQWISFGGSSDPVNTSGFSNISLALCSIHSKILQANRVVAEYNAAIDGQASDVAQMRLERLLSYASPLPARRIGQPSHFVQGATDIQGQAVAQNLTNIAESDSGMLYVDRCGYLAYDSRPSRWNMANAQLIGELAAQILNANREFEAGGAPWTGGFASIAQSAAQAYSGTYSLLITPTSSSNAQAWAGSELDPVPGNASVQASVRAYSPGGWSNFSASVNWYDTTRTYLSTSSATVSLPAATWTLVSNTFTSPPNAAYAQFVPTMGGNPGPSNTLYIDQAVLRLTGETPYLGDFATDYDPSLVFNDITLTQLSGTVVTASSATSRAQFGDQTLQQTAYLSELPVITDLADWILGTYGTPSTRISQLTIDPAANPAAWQAVLSLDVGSVVQATRRLMGTQVEFSGPFVIQSIALSNAPGKFQFRYGLTPYFGNVLATNDAVHGLPNGTNYLPF